MEEILLCTFPVFPAPTHDLASKVGVLRMFSPDFSCHFFLLFFSEAANVLVDALLALFAPAHPCSDSEGANASGIYCRQLPSGTEAQYKLDVTGTNI